MVIFVRDRDFSGLSSFPVHFLEGIIGGCKRYSLFLSKQAFSSLLFFHFKFLWRGFFALNGGYGGERFFLLVLSSSRSFFGGNFGGWRQFHSTCPSPLPFYWLKLYNKHIFWFLQPICRWYLGNVEDLGRSSFRAPFPILLDF